jgi:DNA recombination protein RmuC
MSPAQIEVLIERLFSPEAAPLLVALLAVLVGVVALVLVLARGSGRGSSRGDPRLDQLAGRLGQLVESQAVTANLVGERLQAQERQVTRVLEERIADLTRRLGEGLQKSSDRQAETMQDLRARLATIDAAQKTITDLSQQMAGLEDILSNKQARGALGQTQMEDLVRDILPPNAYRFQAKLGNGRIADCVLDLPNPPGLIAVDAKYPLESFRALRNARDEAERQKAGKAFAADVLKHVKDIAERYIIAEETADSALMFLPAEAVYAELHASFPLVVDEAFRRRVWIVSPTTLMATLNTVRAILKDARMTEMAGIIRKETRALVEDVGRLDERVGNLARHFGQAVEDVRQIQISTEKIVRRGDRIEEVEFGGGEDADGNLLHRA